MRLFQQAGSETQKETGSWLKQFHVTSVGKNMAPMSGRTRWSKR
jgi:hypothetical protein